MSTYECPTCNKQITVGRDEDAPYRPFCSRRCKMVDLGRWLNGTYRISEPIKPQDLERDEAQDES
ncbi:MAG: DNA gyrase inhibitor YacG [Phycisphaerales bacterium]|nr:MAG: DNA gyrase inhibitor YacG [Phycisphaerales bacterium]